MSEVWLFLIIYIATILIQANIIFFSDFFILTDLHASIFISSQSLLKTCQNDPSKYKLDQNTLCSASKDVSFHWFWLQTPNNVLRDFWNLCHVTFMTSVPSIPPPSSELGHWFTSLLFHEHIKQLFFLHPQVIAEAVFCKE